MARARVVPVAAGLGGWVHSQVPKLKQASVQPIPVLCVWVWGAVRCGVVWHDGLAGVGRCPTALSFSLANVGCLVGAWDLRLFYDCSHRFHLSGDDVNSRNRYIKDS